jgi:hypothetical protein
MLNVVNTRRIVLILIYIVYVKKSATPDGVQSFYDLILGDKNRV